MLSVFQASRLLKRKAALKFWCLYALTVGGGVMIRRKAARYYAYC